MTASNAYALNTRRSAARSSRSNTSSGITAPVSSRTRSTHAGARRRPTGQRRCGLCGRYPRCAARTAAAVVQVVHDDNVVARRVQLHHCVAANVPGATRAQNRLAGSSCRRHGSNAECRGSPADAAAVHEQNGRDGRSTAAHTSAPFSPPAPPQGLPSPPSPTTRGVLQAGATNTPPRRM
jgi:hypothetical protein